MTGRSTKDTDEALATQVIQLVLHLPVIQHDDRTGTSEYDLKILYPGGRGGPPRWFPHEIRPVRLSPQRPGSAAILRAVS